MENPIEPLGAPNMFNAMLYIRWRAEGLIPLNPRMEDFLSGRPLREDDGVFVRRVKIPIAFKQP